MNKSTHTIQDVEALLLEKVILLKTAKTKEERMKINKQIKRLEKHFNDCNDKHINGKKYPVREVPPKVTKKELLELIDSVNVNFDREHEENVKMYLDLDLSGVSVGEDRFTFEEKGW